MGFSVPHGIINGLLPRATNASEQEWVGLVKRADQIRMDRRERYGDCTLNNGHADEYEGTWLRDWVGGAGAQRLLPGEVAMVPLFHALTRPLDQVDMARSAYGFAPVRWDDVEGEHCGVRLKDLARRIAATSLEALDGDDSLLAFEALADARPAHTPRELEAMNVILERYFARVADLPAYEDRGAGVAARFRAKETPYEICDRPGTEALYRFRRQVISLTVAAPEDSKVSVVPQSAQGRWVGKPREALVGPGGEVEIDLSDLPRDTCKLALYVVHDEDGRGPAMPVVKARAALPVPRGEFNWKIDNAERMARLKAGLPA